MADDPPRTRLTLAAFTARVRDDAFRFRIATERATGGRGDLFGEMTFEEWMGAFERWALEEGQGRRARPRSNATTVRRRK